MSRICVKIFGLFLLLSMTEARAAGITVTDAKITAGRLVVTGTTPAPNQTITLDNQFPVQSKANGEFKFSVVYLPADCIVDLKAGAKTASAVISGCAVAPSRGADVKGAVSFTQNGVANGRCASFTIGVGGSKVGDAVVVSTEAALQSGVFMYGVGVLTDNQATMELCNLSGTTMAAISGIPVHIVTFRSP